MSKKLAVATTITTFTALSISVVKATAASALSLLDVFSGEYRGEGQPAELFNGADAIIPKAINLMLFIVGVLAIFMMIYGGIRYVLSGGDNAKVKDAKNTILYAIIGLIVAILGYAVVNWIVQTLGGNSLNTTDTTTTTNEVTLLLTDFLV